MGLSDKEQRRARGCMNTLDSINCLIRVEKKYRLLEDDIDGFAYWIFHREAFMEKLLQNKNHYSALHQGKYISAWKKLKLRCGMIINAVFHNSVSLVNAELMVFNHERRVWNGETNECIYTDEIIKSFSSAVVFERPYLQKHLRPVGTDNLVYTDRIEILATLSLLFHKTIMRKRYEQIQMQIRAKIKPVCDEVAQFMQVDYDFEEIVNMMSDGYFLYQSKKKLFDAEIRKYNPKVILEVVGDNVDCMVVNELASRKNIPTIELQHGVTGREHIAYNYPKGAVIRQFPQYFFTFSSYWCTEACYPIPPERCKAVGFPYLERNAEKFCGIRKDEKKIILFISQKPIGRELSAVAVELNQKIDSDVYRIIYKLHPGEYDGWQEDYPELARSGIQVIDNFATELYYLFSVSSYQVGGYGSTAIFEGLYFGLKTFIYKEHAFSFFRSLCEQGFADAFDSTEELYLLIQKSLDADGENVIFWKKNALNNMRDEIEVVMRRNG